MNYKTLLSPININGMTIRNRVVMPPIGSNFASTTGEVTEQMKDYYKLRAKGGTGLIIVENACVDYPMGTNGTKQLRIDNVQFVPGLYELAETIKSYGAKACIQINHAGASAYGLRLEGKQPVSASDIPSKTGGVIPRPLTKEEIETIAEKYGEAAANAKLAGFDMVEIHAGHSYLLSQFISPLFNNRQDEFGGSPKNRARFTRLVIDAIRKKVGKNFPVAMRISADDMMEGGNSLKDTIEILEYLVDGIDLIDVSIAQNDNLYLQHDVMSLPEGWRSYMARAVREKFNLPVITSGNLRTPEVVEKILLNKDADLVSMGRGLIAEPYWVNKVMLDKEDELRRCISCNIGCADHRLAKSRPIRCTVNPDIIREDSYKTKKLKESLKVSIVGGGTAGMEAAATLAEIGFKVDLFEKTDRLGGIISDAAKLPSKGMINYFLEYQKNRIFNLNNINVHLNTEITSENLLDIKPDIIINSIGAVPLIPRIKGLSERLNRDRKVETIFEFLKHFENNKDVLKGKKIVIAGGGAVGLDLVEYFAEAGAKVNCIEMRSDIGMDLDTNTKLYMDHLIDKYNVSVFSSTKLIEVTDDYFIAEDHNLNRIELPYDKGFICLGMQTQGAKNLEFEAVAHKLNSLYINIGDSYKPRKIIDGVFEGRNVIKELERYNYVE